MIVDQNNEVVSYQIPEGYVTTSNNGGTIIADYFYSIPDWLGTNRAIMDATGNVLNANDHYPFGKRMPTRYMVTDAEGNRYQYTGHEFDEEVGYGYHGARYYNRELGKYMNVDRYAENFYGQSPYVYASNTPVVAIDVNGDSTLFWDDQGNYLGYSYDQNKNSITIISSEDVNAFKEIYATNRSEDQFIPSIVKEQEGFDKGKYIEENVAAMSLMGEQYDIDAFENFFADNSSFKVEGGERVPTTDHDFGLDEIEWGNFLVNRGGMITLSSTDAIGGSSSNILWPPSPDDAVGDIHTHPEQTKNRPSGWDTGRVKSVWNDARGQTGFSVVANAGYTVLYRKDDSRSYSIYLNVKKTFTDVIR